jgi:hypothetical protein
MTQALGLFLFFAGAIIGATGLYAPMGELIGSPISTETVRLGFQLVGLILMPFGCFTAIKAR